MSKNIQLPFELLTNTYKLLLRLEMHELDEGTKILCKNIENQIQAKLDAMERHTIFTEYKTAKPDEATREEKRKKYLELVGYHSDWISKKEINQFS